MIYEEILRAFQREKVRYVVVDGIAVNLLGGERATADLDLLVEMTDRNLAKIVRILTRRGYRVRQPVNPMGIADSKIRRNWIREKHMKAFNFFRDEDMKEVDLIIDSPVSYEEAKKKRVRVKVKDLYLPVVSVGHLIKMKRKVGRPIDLADLADLTRLRILRKHR